MIVSAFPQIIERFVSSAIKQSFYCQFTGSPCCADIHMPIGTGYRLCIYM